MTRILLITCLLLVSLSCPAQDLNTILEMNTVAHGGSDNFSRIENVRFLLKISERGATITLVGEVAEGDRQQWQLRLVLPDGFSRDYFVDQKSGRTLRQRDYRAFHPAIDATRETVETRYEGEIWQDGLLRFTRSENRNADTGEWLGTTLVQSVEHNVDLDGDYFQPE